MENFIKPLVYHVVANFNECMWSQVYSLLKYQCMYFSVISVNSNMAAVNELSREKKLTRGIDNGVKFWILVSWLRRARTGGSEDDGRMAGRVKLRPPCIGLSTVFAIVVFALGGCWLALCSWGLTVFTKRTYYDLSLSNKLYIFDFFDFFCLLNINL